MQASELDYALPEDLIAQAPLAERDGARLLWLRRDPGVLQGREAGVLQGREAGVLQGREAGVLEHRQVRDLPALLEPSLIVVNDTRVIPARLFATKPSGGRVEFLLLERLSAPGVRERWAALGKTSKGLREGMALSIAPDFTLALCTLRGGGEMELELAADGGVSSALERHGQVPLPPYIRRPAAETDRERYQTVFASQPGAVAAPTAGLHLSRALLDALAARGHELASITLHVGPGTFAPLRSAALADHAMHEERFRVPEATALAVNRARRQGRPVLAVGTTVVRALEACAGTDGLLEPGAGATKIFIYPPYRFRVIDALLTNFHLPRSSLLALVMAFAGVERVRIAYRQAVAERYRFFSYGDAMLITGRA